MIIAGAGGHAKELAGIAVELGIDHELFFYDDVSPDAPAKLLDRFPVLRTADEARLELARDNRVVLGVGGVGARKILAERFTSWGGQLTSLISPHAMISPIAVQLAEGLNVMTGAVITAEVKIGRGSLIHALASVHHDVVVGEFCEILPGARLLGKVRLGDSVSIGSGAVILPGVQIDSGAVVGAGAVVTKNVQRDQVVKGVPAR